jgi:hypothetical protein
MDRRNQVAGSYRFTADGGGGADGAAPWTADVEVTRAGFWARFAGWHALEALLFVVAVAGVCALTLGQWTWTTEFWSRLPYTSGPIPGAAARAYLFAGAIVAAALAAVEGAGRTSSGTSGLRSLLVGADGRGSTSKAQYLLWTVGLAFALAYISAWAVLDGSHVGDFACVIPKEGGATADHNCVDMRYWESYLVLLGIPAGTAVVAKGVTVRKIAHGRLQKPRAEDQGWVAGLTTNDKGESDIVDAQYLIFNVVTFAYVAAVFVHTGVLAGVPPILYGLTGTGAAAYTLNKSLQENAPRLRSVVPGTVHPGESILVRGDNLFPAGASDSVLAVMVGGIDAAVLRERPEVDQLTAVVPGNVRSGDVDVSVITSAGLQTPGLSVSVDDALSIWLASTARPVAGRELTFGVRGLPASATKADVTVHVGGREWEATKVSDRGRRVTVAPPETQEQTLRVFLRYHGHSSNTVTVQPRRR